MRQNPPSEHGQTPQMSCINAQPPLPCQLILPCLNRPKSIVKPENTSGTTSVKDCFVFRDRIFLIEKDGGQGHNQRLCALSSTCFSSPSPALRLLPAATWSLTADSSPA